MPRVRVVAAVEVELERRVDVLRRLVREEALRVDATDVGRERAQRVEEDSEAAGWGDHVHLRTTRRGPQGTPWDPTASHTPWDPTLAADLKAPLSPV
jgi:hypothetical protein